MIKYLVCPFHELLFYLSHFLSFPLFSQVYSRNLSHEVSWLNAKSRACILMEAFVSLPFNDGELTTLPKSGGRQRTHAMALSNDGLGAETSHTGIRVLEGHQVS